MSIVAEPETAWDIAPGWAIHADLTPPELVNARQLTVVRRRIVVGLVLLVLALVLGYAAARLDAHNAAGAVNDEQARTASLQAQESSYSEVTQINGSVAQIRSQLAALMPGDVNFNSLLRSLRAALPPQMTINQLGITISPVSASTDGAGTSNGTTLDTSGRQQIGKVTLGGTGQTVDSAARFVVALKHLPAMVDVVAETNSRESNFYAYTISTSVNDRLLTHRFGASSGSGTTP